VASGARAAADATDNGRFICKLGWRRGFAGRLDPSTPDLGQFRGYQLFRILQPIQYPLCRAIDGGCEFLHAWLSVGPHAVGYEAGRCKRAAQIVSEFGDQLLELCDPRLSIVHGARSL
jgi:hypothetical protein